MEVKSVREAALGEGSCRRIKRVSREANEAASVVPSGDDGKDDREAIQKSSVQCHDKNLTV